MLKTPKIFRNLLIKNIKNFFSQNSNYYKMDSNLVVSMNENFYKDYAKLTKKNKRLNLLIIFNVFVMVPLTIPISLYLYLYSNIFFLYLPLNFGLHYFLKMLQKKIEDRIIKIYIINSRDLIIIITLKKIILIKVDDLKKAEIRNEGFDKYLVFENLNEVIELDINSKYLKIQNKNLFKAIVKGDIKEVKKFYR